MSNYKFKDLTEGMVIEYPNGEKETVGNIVDRAVAKNTAKYDAMIAYYEELLTIIEDTFPHNNNNAIALFRAIRQIERLKKL